MARPKAADMYEWVCPGCGYQLQTISTIAPYHSTCGKKFKRSESMMPLELQALKNQEPKKGRKE